MTEAPVLSVKNLAVSYKTRKGKVDAVLAQPHLRRSEASRNARI